MNLIMDDTDIRPVLALLLFVSATSLLPARSGDSLLSFATFVGFNVHFRVIRVIRGLVYPCDP